MRDIDEVFAVLGRSGFRSRFRLSGREAEYLEQKGLATILEHARNFVTKRLADAEPVNDGRQTPMKNHPVFVAQHAASPPAADDWKPPDHPPTPAEAIQPAPRPGTGTPPASRDAGTTQP